MRVVAVALYRIAHTLGARSGLLGMLVKQLNQFVTGADIAYQADLGAGLRLPHPIGVVVGVGVRCGTRCTLHAGVVLGSNHGYPSLGDDVNLGPHVVITGPVRLGSRVHVGANSVVTRDFGDDVVLVGAPARVLRDAGPAEGRLAVGR